MRVYIYICLWVFLCVCGTQNVLLRSSFHCNSKYPFVDNFVNVLVESHWITESDAIPLILFRDNLI